MNELYVMEKTEIVLKRDTMSHGDLMSLRGRLLYAIQRVMCESSEMNHWAASSLSFAANELIDRIYRAYLDNPNRWVSSKGKYPKRFKRALRDMRRDLLSGCKNDDDPLKVILLLTISALLEGRELWNMFAEWGKAWKAGKTLVIDITDVFDWRAGDYGDSGSCYWEGQACARDTLEYHGALCLRYYRPDTRRGYGRCWIVPIEGPGDALGYALFNSYGEPLETSAQVIAQLTEASYQIAVDLRNNRECYADLYINHGDGIIVSDYNRWGDFVDLELEIIYGKYSDDCRSISCEICGYSYNEDYLTYVDSVEQLVCEDCLNGYLYCCKECGDYHPEEEVIDIGPYNKYVWVCKECYKAEYVEICPECKQEIDTFEGEELVFAAVLGQYVCDACYNRRYAHCSKHGQQYELIPTWGDCQLCAIESLEVA